MGETRAPSRNEIFSASLKVLNASKKHHGNATVGCLLDLEVRIFLAVARKSGLRVITCSSSRRHGIRHKICSRFIPQELSSPEREAFSTLIPSLKGQTEGFRDGIKFCISMSQTEGINHR